MSVELTWLGHGTWSLKVGDSNVLLDPFLDGNPAATVKASEVDADFILVSHGHDDHVADVGSIAMRTGATVVAMVEVADWFKANTGVSADKTIGMNLGGSLTLSFGRVTMTVAHHSSSMPDGSYGGNPAGFILEVEGKTIYFACDTALFGDMELIGRRGIDVAVLPIGDFYTMGPDDAVEAVKLIKPKRVLPAHYNTWPPIEQDADAWATKVQSQTSAEPTVLAPGQSTAV